MSFKVYDVNRRRLPCSGRTRDEATHMVVDMCACVWVGVCAPIQLPLECHRPRLDARHSLADVATATATATTRDSLRLAARHGQTDRRTDTGRPAAAADARRPVLRRRRRRGRFDHARRRYDYRDVNRLRLPLFVKSIVYNRSVRVVVASGRTVGRGGRRSPTVSVGSHRKSQR